MREYKFRGFNSLSGWVYGSLLTRTTYLGMAMQTDEICIKQGNGTIHGVAKESVGQWTGLKTPNTREPGWDYKLKESDLVEIYEGDIVEAMSEGYKGRFVISWRQESNPGWILFPAWQHRKIWNLHGSKLNKYGVVVDEVIILGNIFENPQLMNH